MQKEPSGGVLAEPVDHGPGRSRGEFTTKLHLAVEPGRKPWSRPSTSGCDQDPHRVLRSDGATAAQAPAIASVSQ
ncbi:hypothetical protein ABIA38_007579 [Embleya sp. AB8]